MTVFTRTNIRLLVLLPWLSFQSCQFFDAPTSREKLLQNELKSINWNQVDEFPMIAECEILNTPEQQKQCFFEFLSADIKKRIKNNLKDTIFIKDTIFVKVIIMPTSKVIFQTSTATNSSFIECQIDSILRKDTLNFPNVKPASKRGMLVKSEFILPIIF